jgi:succinoglycan biosynthesis transport protein ExoP
VRDALSTRPTTLAGYLEIVRRRIWIILVLLVLAAGSAYFIGRSQSPLYKATAQILVNRASVVTAISGVQDPTLGDPTRFLATEADIARSPTLLDRVVASAHVPGMTTGSQLLAQSDVTPESNADLLDISVSWPTPGGATTLTNTYADEFTRYKTELDTQKVNAALATIRARIASLEARGKAGSQSLVTLEQYQSQLETIGTLLAGNTTVLRPAPGAGKLRPRPNRAAILGALLGAALGLGLAFLLEALDRRVRSESEIEDMLGMPLLGRLPEPARHLRDAKALVTLREPASVQAESFRKLRTTVELLNLERGATTMMVTSAVPGEGKSTTVANLAVSFARSGRQVALVDLDLRRPILHSFFPTGSDRGVLDIAAGRESLDSVMRPVILPDHVSFAGQRSNGGMPKSRGNGHDHGENNVLKFLPAGSPHGGSERVDLFEKQWVTDLLDDLAAQSDVVLIDAPPLLTVDDAMALTTKVDAIIVVLHTGIPRPLLNELARQLETSRAPALGFVLTGVDESRTYGYGYYGYGGYHGAPLDVGRSAERV